MRLIVTGASGLVGSALTVRLSETGHEVVRLVRREARGPGEVRWNPEERGSAGLDAGELGKVDGVVHLAGENIAGARWSAAVKERIRNSRVNGTGLLAQALAGMREPPRVLVCASAIGYYGNRGEQELSEESEPGTGYLPAVCAAWEAACEPVRVAGVRVVNLRIGVVLSARGGALERMLPPFRLGGGGVLGSGEQYTSWISLTDLVEVVRFALENESLRGAVNAVSPAPVTNRVFTKTLGRVLRRPTVLPMPAFAARLAFGEMADALLLGSTRVAPERLLECGFAFQHADLEDALRHAIETRM